MRCRIGGFSAIEVLIVVVASAILCAMIVPAVQSSRESARRSQCIDNLRQLGAACAKHEAAATRLPTNGWAQLWVGDPDRGTDMKQPGGWIFNILPYVDQQGVHDLQAGLSGEARAAAATKMIHTPLPIVICPGRREAKLFTAATPMSQQYFITGGLAAGISESARNDYAGNGGATFTDGTFTGLFSYTALPPDTSAVDAMFGTSGLDEGRARLESQANGIFHCMSVVTMEQISDGAANTYLCGEKFVQTNHYADGLDGGDQQCLYAGDSPDITRWASPEYPPEQDAPDREAPRIFGSVHPGIFNMCFCDGSVRAISYGIDTTVHGCFANRKDGEKVTPGAINPQ